MIMGLFQALKSTWLVLIGVITWLYLRAKKSPIAKWILIGTALIFVFVWIPGYKKLKQGE
jgi:hypothetical protein